MPTKFIQFERRENSNEYFNINAITKIETAISDEWDYEERLIVHIQGRDPFMLEPGHPQIEYLRSLMEDFPEEKRLKISN